MARIMVTETVFNCKVYMIGILGSIRMNKEGHTMVADLNVIS
jgi:hypothetical protein